MNLAKLFEEKVDAQSGTYLGIGTYVAQVDRIDLGESPKSGDPRCAITFKVLSSEGTDRFKAGTSGSVVILLRAGKDNKMNRDRYKRFIAAASGVDPRDTDAVNALLGKIKDPEKYVDTLIGKKVAIEIKQAFGKGGPIFTKNGSPFTNAEFFAV